MKRLALLGLLLLAACGQTGTDNYSFEQKQYQHDVVVVEVITHPNLASLQEDARMHGKASTNEVQIQAFSVINPSSNKCEIHMVDPLVKYSPEFIGHEFAHCVFGQFHPNQP